MCHEQLFVTVPSARGYRDGGVSGKGGHYRTRTQNCEYAKGACVVLPREQTILTEKFGRAAVSSSSVEMVSKSAPNLDQTAIVIVPFVLFLGGGGGLD